MIKRVIAVMMSMIMLLGVFSSITVSAATIKEVTLFSARDILAEGVAWSGTTQYSGNRGQLVHKNNGESAMLTFKANVTGLEKITINAASAYAETYTVKIGESMAGSVSHAERKTSSGKLDFADYDNDITITTDKMGEQTITITDVTQETYINKVTLSYSGDVPEEPDTTSIQIKSADTNKVIDVTGAGTANGDIVISADSADTASQRWTLEEDVQKGWYYIVNKNSNKGIGMSGGTTAAGEQPVQWECDGSANQFWRFVKVEKDNETYYKILNKNSKRVLTAAADGKVTQEDWNADDSQLWLLEPAENLPESFGSDYDDDYAVTNISASATGGVISYKVIHTKGEGMTLKVTLSDNQELTSAEGAFNRVADGTYTITACVYDGDTAVCDPLTKEITLTDGEYSVVGAKWISSTEQNMYADNGIIETRDIENAEAEEIKASDSGKVWIDVDQDTVYQQMDSHPWGGCFNEMGWSVMKDLSEDEKKVVVASLFGDGEDSLNFTAARMSIGSSDFGDDMYTFADKEYTTGTDGIKRFNDASMTDDEAMANFSIERDVVGINGDGQSMMKYISTALDLVPDLEIFGSPWSPPAWMKQNNTTLNGIGDGINKWEDKESNYEYYAEYFVKFLDAYATAVENKAVYQAKYPTADLSWLDRNIYLKAITPQNEVTMDTPYPSCILTGEQHNKFIRDYLYNKVKEYNEIHTDRRDVEIWLGTFTDSQKSYAMPAIQDDETRAMLGAACFQWWGAPLAAQVHMNEKYRNLKLVQSETKCGNSQNNWTYAEEQFDNFKEFLDAGISQYHLWNMILDSRGHNNAMPRNRQWPQNAPITVDGTTVTYRPSYYLTKHFSSNVKPNARRIKTDGNTLRNGSVKGHVQDLRAIAFQNTDGEIVLNVKNSTSAATPVTVIVEGKAFDVTVPAHSINTFSLNDETFEYKSIEDKADMTETVEIEESVDVKLENVENGLLLSSEGYDNGTDITTTTNRGEAYQTWSILNNADNSGYRLKNFRSELVMCVWSGSKEENAKISQYTDTAAPDQSWKLDLMKVEGQGDDAKYYYRIVNVNSNLALTALGGENDLVTQKKYTGADNQLWAMNIVSGDEKWTHGTPIDETKITDKTYSFVTDTVNSDGYVYNNEWDITAAPQYFYVDTVEADKIKSLTIRSGYETGEAEVSVYVCDNADGEPITKEELNAFEQNQTGLTKIGSAKTSKTTVWEYNTAVIAADAVTLSENGKDVYTLDSENSKKLDLIGITGKKALIVAIYGNIGSKAYFDNIKINYSEPVKDKMPDIEGVSGEGVKSNSVLIDKTVRKITVPVVPGKLTDDWKPEIEIAYPAKAELTSGTWKDGTLTVTFGEDTADWTIKCVEYGNPVLDGFYADPGIVCFDGKFYIYPTTDGGTSWDAPNFRCFSSDDLVNWTDEGIILDLKDVSWSNGKNGWAPTIAEKDGTYYFYYSAAPTTRNAPKNLAVATAKSPTGPFVDQGVIVEKGSRQGQMIDPAVFIDDDGQGYLYWGNGALYVAKLTDDMLHIDGDIKTITPPAIEGAQNSSFREAVFVIKRNDQYYFLWSANDTGEVTYEVHYGTSDSPMGPIEGDTTILSYTSADADSKIKGTGHCSVVNVPNTDEWYICYHRFNIPLYGDVADYSQAAGNHRETCIDKLEFNADGTIKPVKPTLEGITEPVKVTVPDVKEDIKVSLTAEMDNGKINYSAKVQNADETEYDLYVAAYDASGVLSKVTKNEPIGELEAADISYTVKAMVWEKGGMKPLCDADSVTVKNTDDDMSAYLFVHFTGTDRGADSEQIYFSVSSDGTTWRRLNDNEPVLKSEVGTKGMRDPFIIRSPEGDKFYMIATDLSVHNINGDWGASQTEGSKNIVVYESEDLVNWTGPSLREVGVEDAGCVWAPEAVYDDEKQMYMVFWASKVGSDGYKKQRVYRCYTKDFVTFTEPEVYIDYAKDSIDTTFAKEDGVYYRFTKNESKSSVIMEKSTALDGVFEEVSTYTLDGTAGNTVTGFEGPTAYKLNGTDTWCLLLDNYGGVGYKPFVTDDISNGEFVSESEFKLDSTYRHGTVIPITRSEYNSLLEAYPVEKPEKGEMIFSMDFEDNTTPTIGEATANGDITYTEGFNGGKAAVLDGNDYIEITKDKDGQNPLAGLNSFTISFTAKANGKSWLFYTAPDDSSQVYRSEKYIGALYDDSNLKCERYNSDNVKARPAVAEGSVSMNDWEHITISYRGHMTVIYVDGKEIARRETVDIPDLLGNSPVAYIGRAMWGGGEYSNCVIDDFKIYNYALSSEEAAADYASKINN